MNVIAIDHRNRTNKSGALCTKVPPIAKRKHGVRKIGRLDANATSTSPDSGLGSSESSAYSVSPKSCLKSRATLRHSIARLSQNDEEQRVKLLKEVVNEYTNSMQRSNTTDVAIANRAINAVWSRYPSDTDSRIFRIVDGDVKKYIEKHKRLDYGIVTQRCSPFLNGRTLDSEIATLESALASKYSIRLNTVQNEVMRFAKSGIYPLPGSTTYINALLSLEQQRTMPYNKKIKLSNSFDEIVKKQREALNATSPKQHLEDYNAFKEECKAIFNN